MTNFKALKQFDKEFKKFLKRHDSLERDIQTLKNIIQVNPKGDSQHIRILKQQDAIFVIKARLACRALKIGIAGTPLRVIYAYNKTHDFVVFLEIYSKQKTSKPNQKRIDDYLKKFDDAVDL